MQSRTIVCWADWRAFGSYADFRLRTLRAFWCASHQVPEGNAASFEAVGMPSAVTVSQCLPHAIKNYGELCFPILLNERWRIRALNPEIDPSVYAKHCEVLLTSS